MKTTIIAAVARNGVIGIDNDLPWRLPGDLENFQRRTRGHTLLMGRRTWESIGGVLPNRTAIVVSSTLEELPEGATLVRSLEEGIEVARDSGEDELFIAGGGGIYEAGFAHAQEMVLTLVDEDFEGDAHFPPFSHEIWCETGREEFPKDDRNPHAFAICIFERRT